MSEFVWNICLLRLRVGHRVWRIRLGKAKSTADPRGWHKLAGHLYVCVFGVEGERPGREDRETNGIA